MSVVFRALDRRREEALDRHPHVAIKVLGDEFKRHPDALRALQRESRKTQRLAHPEHRQRLRLRPGRTQRLHGNGAARRRAARRTVAATRLCSGSKKRKPCACCRKWARGCHMRTVRIVRSDFKPSNAFVTLSGETEAHRFRRLPGHEARECPGQNVLTMFDAGKLGAITVAYCSPEQMLGDADPDPRDDVYALGVVATSCSRVSTRSTAARRWTRSSRGFPSSPSRV